MSNSATRIAHERSPSFRFVNIQSAIDMFMQEENQEVDYEGPLGSLEVCEDGLILFANREFRSTDEFIYSLSTYVGYPYAIFGSKLDVGHIAKDLNNLIAHKDKDNAVLRAWGNKAVEFYGFAARPRIPMRLTDLIPTLKTFEEGDGSTISFANGRLKSAVVRNLIIDPSKRSAAGGDPSRIDMYVESGYGGGGGGGNGSNSGFRMKRHACDNSTIVTYGNRSIKPQDTAQNSLNAFLETLPGLKLIQDHMPDAYDSMVAQDLTTDEYLEDREIFYNAMGQRMANNFLSAYHKTDAENKIIIDLGALRGKTAYSLFNDVTWNSKSMSTAESIQELASVAAGDLFKKFLKKVGVG
jgi:hypothetical protein